MAPSTAPYGRASGPPFSDIDTVTVNFVGARHLIESLVPKMRSGSAVVCVASNAGLGWQPEIANLLPFITLPDFDDQVKWLQENPEKTAGGYAFSKQVLNPWVAWRPAARDQDRVRPTNPNPRPPDPPKLAPLQATAGAGAAHHLHPRTAR